MSDPGSLLHRPWWLKVVHGGGGLVERTGLLRFPLDSDALLERAARRVGYEDFGPDDFREAMDVLLASYRNDAKLNFMGRAMATTYVEQLLENRLLVERARSDSVAAERIERPVFIVGLPRTGSTILYELVNAASGWRAPLTWEIMFPDPPPGLATDAVQRELRADNMLKWVDRLSPDFRRIHPLGGALPQECIMILSIAFRSVQFHTYNNVPSYQEWLHGVDQRPGYRYHERFLQHLQAHGAQRNRRWLLKSPAHVFGLDALFEVYPDAYIVQTHRDPGQVIGSVSSLMLALRQAFTDRIDPRVIGAQAVDIWTRSLSDSIDFREAHPELADRFIDVRYDDFMADPLGTVAAIREHVDMPFGPDDEARVNGYLSANPQNRHGRHSYTLADFGLSADSVSEQFQRYRHAYGV